MNFCPICPCDPGRNQRVDHLRGPVDHDGYVFYVIIKILDAVDFLHVKDGMS
jgi:hypothetical protein